MHAESIYMFFPTPVLMQMWGSHDSDYAEHIFWDMTPCTLVGIYWCFREMYCLHLQQPRASRRGSTCSCVAPTHNTHIKIISEFIDDMKKLCLKTGQRFPTKIYLKPWKWMVAALDGHCLKESFFSNYMKQNTSWEADTCLIGQEIYGTWRLVTMLTRAHHLCLLLSHKNSVHILKLIFLQDPFYYYPIYI
jgi:hypothetical protein